MKLFELEDYPLPFLLLQKMLNAGQDVVLVRQQKDAFTRMGTLVKAEAGESRVFGTVYTLTYFTNNEFEVVFGRVAMEEAKFRTLELKGGSGEEKCFVVPIISTD